VADRSTGGQRRAGTGCPEQVSVGSAPATWGYLALAVSGREVVAAAPGSSRKGAIEGLLLPAEGAEVGGWANELARIIVESLEAGEPLEEVVPRIEGTPFQAAVWEALREVPPGTVTTYSDLAAGIGRPTATRAVASACAANRLGLIVPCHRVVRSDGSLGGYRWGEQLKRDILEAERACGQQGPQAEAGAVSLRAA